MANQPGDIRHTRQWRKLRDQVVREEPVCYLRLSRCTTRSTTADHVLPYRWYPHLGLVRSNLRGVCAECNREKWDKLPDASAESPALQFFDL